MATRIYKLYGTTGSDTNALAQLTIQRPGSIVAVWWAGYANSTSDNSGCRVELSFTSTSQIGTNDTVGPISECNIHQNLVTSGLVTNHVNSLHAGLNVPVQAGDRLYMNIDVVGTATWLGSAYVSVDER